MQLKICLPGNKVVSFALSLFPFPSWAARKSKKQVEKRDKERQRQRTPEQATTLLMQSQTNMQMNGKCKGEKKARKKATAKQSKSQTADDDVGRPRRRRERGRQRGGKYKERGCCASSPSPVSSGVSGSADELVCVCVCDFCRCDLWRQRLQLRALLPLLFLPRCAPAPAAQGEKTIKRGSVYKNKIKSLSC